MLSQPVPVVIKFPSSREEIASIFMEGDCHYAIGLIESEFDTIPVMNVNINIENAGVIPKIN